MFFTKYDTVTFSQLREYIPTAPVRSKHLIEITPDGEYKAFFKTSPDSAPFKKSKMTASEHAMIKTLMIDSISHNTPAMMDRYLIFRIARKYLKSKELKKKYKPDPDSKLVR